MSITGAFPRTIVDWFVSSALKTEMIPLHALNLEAWSVTGVTELAQHSGIGSNYVSASATDRIVELGGTPSLGYKVDSYGKAAVPSWFAFLQDRTDQERRP